MRTADRVRALEATRLLLVWLVEDFRPGVTRWAMAHRVLGDHHAAATIAAGSSSSSAGRAPVGSHSDPVAAAVMSLDRTVAAATGQVEVLVAHEVTIAELARWLRSTLAGAPHPGPDALHAALADVSWCEAHHGPILAGLDRSSGLLADVDDAVATLAQVTGILATRVRRSLVASVREPPKVRQEAGECRAHKAAGHRGVQPFRNGLCYQCFKFRDNHDVEPTEAIIRRLDCGQRPTPAMLIEARAAARRRRRARR